LLMRLRGMGNLPDRRRACSSGPTGGAGRGINGSQAGNSPD
jgi:hypothetical protein